MNSEIRADSGICNETKEKQRLAVSALLLLNRLFPEVKHPFNLSERGYQSYAEWEYQKAEKLYDIYDGKLALENKRVLDIGCGSGGKTVYFLTHGAASAVGADICEKYAKDAEAFAEAQGVGDRFSFICADAASLPLESDSFDAAVMNDSAEHVGNLAGVLAEAYRVLKPNGRLYVNFPPYFHPFGAHLSDLIRIPWVHLFFSEQTLICAYRRLAETVDDGTERVNFRFSPLADGSGEYISYINHMTAARFGAIVGMSDFRVLCYRELPLRKMLAPLAALKRVGKPFVGCVVAILEKPKA